MKKSILAIAMVLFSVQIATAQESYSKDANLLPAKAKEFLKTHFAKETVSYILIDKEVLSTEYEAVLSNGQEIKFDKNGEWLEIEGKKKALPESAIPGIVRSSINTKFKDVAVEQIERERWGYEVQLMNGLELKIDKKGKIIEIDN